MGKYHGAVITTAGQNVIAQAISGTKMTWTVMRTSSTVIPASTNLETLTSLSGIEQTSNITDATIYGDNVLQVSARFSNTGISIAYYIQTVGIYGQLAGGSETLIAVMTAVTPDEMPVYDPDAPSAFIFNTQITVQNAQSIVMTVNDTGTATVADLNRKVDKQGGDISDTVAMTATTSTASYPVPAAGDSMSVITGKIIKFFGDIVKTFTGATSSATGKKGLVPAPTAGGQAKYLRGDATWQAPINNATATAAGGVLDARMGKTLQDQITSLNNSLPIIVYAGSVVNDSITIPSRWAIIYVNVWIANNSSRGITFTILRGFMSTGNGYTFRNGYYESTSNCALCEVGVVFNSDGSIMLRLNKAFLGGTDYVSTSSLSVSYTLLGT